MSNPFVGKEYLVRAYLEQRPRLNNLANVQLISEEIPVGKDKLFRLEYAQEILPDGEIDRAIVRLHGRLADNFEPEINSFFRRHTEFLDNMANKKIVSESLERSFVGESPSESDLEDLLDIGNANGCYGELLRSAESLQAEGDEHNRQQLAEKLIVNLIPLRLDGKDTHADRRRVEDRRKREEQIRGMSIDQLKELREERRLRDADASSLRAIVKASDNQRAAQFQQFAPWPGLYAPRGKDVSEVGIPLTKVLFARLPIDEQKRLLRVFGPDAINKAIREATKS